MTDQELALSAWSVYRPGPGLAKLELDYSQYNIKKYHTGLHRGKEALKDLNPLLTLK